MINYFYLVAILGLISIITGTLLVSQKRIYSRKFTYPLLILGGICLEIYSIYINDLIFIILQGIFIVSSVYGLIRLRRHVGGS